MMHWSIPELHITNDFSIANLDPQTMIDDMWRTCPALCWSIRQDFDLTTIFHPRLFALHGETFLQLTASKIAMQNQAAEMGHMRSVLSRLLVLLDANSATSYDLQTRLTTQQSELSEIRSILRQQLQILSGPPEASYGQVVHSGSSASGVNLQNARGSPQNLSSIRSVEGSVYEFYRRTAALPPLNLILPYDDIDRYREKFGYGHAETQGRLLQYPVAETGVPEG